MLEIPVQEHLDWPRRAPGQAAALVVTAAGYYYKIYIYIYIYNCITYNRTKHSNDNNKNNNNNKYDKHQYTTSQYTTISILTVNRIAGWAGGEARPPLYLLLHVVVTIITYV